MPVDEVLATHSSRQLAEWMAYENEYGPINSAYEKETLAQMHELLQRILHLHSQVNSKDGRSEETIPRRHARPGERME